MTYGILPWQGSIDSGSAISEIQVIFVFHRSANPTNCTYAFKMVSGSSVMFNARDVDRDTDLEVKAR